MSGKPNFWQLKSQAQRVSGSLNSDTPKEVKDLAKTVEELIKQLEEYWPEDISIG